VKILRFMAVWVIMAMVLAPAVWAQDLEKHLNQANALYKQKKYEGAIGELRQALKILKEGGNPAGAQQIQMNIGINYIKLEKYAEAAKELEDAKGLYKTPDPKIDLRLNTLLAMAHYNMGNYALRASILEGLLKKYKNIDDATKADMWAQLGDSYRRNEIHSKAVYCYGQALTILKKLDDKPKQALVLTAMGLSQSKLADFDAAAKSLNAALELAKGLDNLQNTAETFSNLGIVHWDQGEYDKALEYITEAKKVETDNNLKKNLGADFNNEGLIYKSAGNYDKALASIEMSIKIAREINDKRSEAIALSNRGLILRIQGSNAEAVKDYQAALKIYESVKFKEGTASCYLGLGKLYEVVDRDYKKALDHYEKALALYQELGNLAYQAETLNQIGRVLKRSVEPDRATRDLVFEEEQPQVIQMSPQEAAEKSLAAYKEALELAQRVNKKEAIWSAQQGIGYALQAQGKDEEALKYYRSAVDTVINIRGGDGESELLANYMNDKDDLFTEAIELLAGLYSKTKKDEYLQLQMEYQEIYKNEVMKVAMTGARLEYEDKNKAGLMDKLNKALAQKDKLDQLAGTQESIMAQEPKDEAAKPEFEERKKMVAAEKKHVEVRAKKLETSIAQLLKQWKTKYPSDAGMFDSSAKVNMKALQKGLAPNEALIQYFPLPDKLSILCLTKEEILTADYPISYKDLALMIEQKFTAGVDQFQNKWKDAKETKDDYLQFAKVLNEFYGILLKPVEKAIAEKERIIVVPSKAISYIPFAALVSEFESDGQPHYVVQDRTVSYIRLSFLKTGTAKRKAVPFNQYKILAIGNPTHNILKVSLPPIKGTEVEVQNLTQVTEKAKMKPPVTLMQKEATEDTWREMVLKEKFNVMYFATHGVPFAEVIWLKRKIESSSKEKIRQRFSQYMQFVQNEFKSKSPLYGFLYMAYEKPGGQNGVLTLKEIMELPESVFSQAEIAVLSACNTAVTFSPKVDKDIREEMTGKDVSRELVEEGWTPGVDQICLTDTFMKRNFRYVMGTFWAAPDDATQFIVSQFFNGLIEHDPPEAFRQAQLAFLKDPSFIEGNAPAHPYFWAVGALYGR
jgi:tetratricopeptide (TPR) repeat protein/CHAT domain-containing protein